MNGSITQTAQLPSQLLISWECHYLVTENFAPVTYITFPTLSGLLIKVTDAPKLLYIDCVL